MDPVPLSGGPSDGKTYQPITKWPLYLHPDGTIMPAQLGHRVMNGRSTRKSCYVAQRPPGHAGRVTHYEYREVES